MEYIVNISGDNTLEDIGLMIGDEEAGRCRFLRSSVSYHDHKITNLATFEEMPSTQPLLPELVLMEGTPPASDNVKVLWAGVMLTNKGLVAATAHR